MSFEDLKREVQAGLDGRNNGIPMGFDRLNRYIGIRKGMYPSSGLALRTRMYCPLTCLVVAVRLTWQ